MVTRIHPAQPSLRRRIEQALSATPEGLGWRSLSEELTRRSVVRGGEPVAPRQVVRELGTLLVEGRVDERDGRFVLLTVCGRRAPEMHGARRAA